MAFQRGDDAVVPAPGALRRAGVSPIQRGAASPEEERRRAHEGRGHLQATERVGGVPGEAERSDPAVHFLRRCKNTKVGPSNRGFDVMPPLVVTDVSPLPLAP